MVDRKFILNFTPTGMTPTREMTPHVPLTPAEIVEQTCQAADLGANMIHLHARDPDTERPTWRKEVYGQIIAGIRERHPELVLGVSTSGRDFQEYDQRADVLKLEGHLKPDFASLTLSSMNFNKQASINTPEMIQTLAREMLDRDIRPELEAFDLGMVNYAKYLIRKGLVRPPFYFNVILGTIACAQANMLSLGLMQQEMPPDTIWSAGGVGNSQLKVNVMALLADGGVRIGLEDNIWFDPERTHLASNREMVDRVLIVARTLGKTPYTHAETRAMLGL